MAQLNSTNILGNLAISGNTLSSKFIKLDGTGTQVLLANGEIKEISGTWPISISGNAATATALNVTDTTPTSATTYYLWYSTGKSGAQTARANADLYVYDTGTSSYLNVGSSSNSGMITLHHNKGGYVNIQTAEIPSGTTRTLTIPNASGTISLEGHTHSYLPLAGGTMTGSIKFYNSSTTANSTFSAITYQSNTRTGIPIKFISGDVNGSGILIGDGGATIIGGGEAAANLWSALGIAGSAEELHLANDQAIKFHSNCQTVANRKTTTYDASGNWTMPGSITATSFIKNGGNNTQILMADGTTRTWYPASSCTSFTDDVGTLSPAAVKKAVTETFSSAAGNRGNGILVKAAAAGQINSEKYAVTSSGTVKATWQYNSATDCIELAW